MAGRKKPIKKFICHVSGGYKIEDIDEFRCFIANFVATLTHLNFPYICFGLLAIIILISFFGRIKENYKWFILNSAIWDLFVCYYTHCMDFLYIYLDMEKMNITCFFNDWKSFYINRILINIIRNNPYSALVLLSFTRFCALYFMNFYDKLTRGRRILYLILIFNFIMIILNIAPLFPYLSNQRLQTLANDCERDCDFDDDFQLTWFKNLNNIFMTIGYILPLIFLLLSTLAAIMLIFRIGKQAKFQIKHNRRDFLSSIRITIVIGFQILINSGVLFLESIFNLGYLFEYIFNIPVLRTSRENIYDDNICKECLDFRFPYWIDGEWGLAGDPVLETILQLRIFIDSILVLLIMTGYREAIVDLIKFIYRVIRHPQTSSTNLKANFTKSRVIPFK